MEQDKSALNILTCKSTRKRYLGRSRRTKEKNIRIDLKEFDDDTRNYID